MSRAAQFRQGGPAPFGPLAAPVTPSLTLWMPGHVSALHGRRLCTRLRPPTVSAKFLNADQVARRIAEGAVANAIRLLRRLLDDLGGVAGLHLPERAVEVLGGQKDPAVGALGHHLGDSAALILGNTRIGDWRRQEDGRVGLAGRADGDPAHLAGSDVGTDLEAEGVAIEG